MQPGREMPVCSRNNTEKITENGAVKCQFSPAVLRTENRCQLEIQEQPPLQIPTSQRYLARTFMMILWIVDFFFFSLVHNCCICTLDITLDITLTTERIIWADCGFSSIVLICRMRDGMLKNFQDLLTQVLEVGQSIKWVDSCIFNKKWLVW